MEIEKLFKEKKTTVPTYIPKIGIKENKFYKKKITIYLIMFITCLVK